MEAVRAPAPAPAPAPALRPATGAPLKLGDVVVAVVQARLSETSFLLQLNPGGRSVVAHSAADLPPGTSLKLEVAKLGALPELRPVPADAPVAGAGTATAPAPADSAQGQALRLFLPKQLALAEFAAELPELAGRDSPLPAPLKQAIETLLAALPRPGQLGTPDGLKRSLQDSGVFFEARLAAGPGPGFPESDFKGRLLDLLHRLEAYPREAAPTPETGDFARQETGKAGGDSALDALAQKVEGALARVGLNQLASLPQPDGGQSWRLEIPCADGDRSNAAKLLIESEQRRQSSGESAPSWSVNLELSPPGLGAFCARIVLTGGRIDAYLWSDRAGTAGLIQGHREFLRARLEQAGLAVGRLDALEHPPSPARPERPAAPLLDLRA
jgi:hypothetical protein